MNTTAIDSNTMHLLDDEELEANGGVAPLAVWGAICLGVVAVGAFSDAVNGVYDFMQGWNNYEPQPHVTSTIHF